MTLLAKEYERRKNSARNMVRELADLLKKNEGTIRRYISGEITPPPMEQSAIDQYLTNLKRRKI